MRVFGFMEGRQFYGAGGGVGGRGWRPGMPSSPLPKFPPPPVPKPFVPSWKIASDALAARAAGFLAQLWGVLNPGRVLRQADKWEELTFETVTWASPATVAFDYKVIEDWRYTYVGGTQEFAGRKTTTTGTVTIGNCSGIRWKVSSGSPPYGPHNAVVPGLYGEVAYLRDGVWRDSASGGNEGVITIYTGGTGYPSNWFVGSGVWSAFMTGVRRDGVAQPPPRVIGANEAIKAPAVEAKPVAAPLPSLVPSYLPVVKPVELPGDPVAQPDVDGAPAKLPPLVTTVGGTEVKVPTLPRPTKPSTGVATTPAGSVIPWPGAKPVGLPGQAPAATLEGIAHEVGKIERKMEIAFSPPEGAPAGWDWEDVWEAWRLLSELLAASEDKGSYELFSPCLPDDELGGKNNPLKREWDGSWSFEGQVMARLDALAGLLQDSKALRQPICHGTPAVGEEVTVTFASSEIPADRRSRLEKRLVYRDQTGAETGVHADHWRDFEWQSGPVIVESRDAVWGKVKVWAASELEGKRVIKHAAAIAGVDLSADGHRWLTSQSSDPRYGRRATFRVKGLNEGFVAVTKRPGPSGTPLVTS